MLRMGSTPHCSHHLQLVRRLAARKMQLYLRDEPTVLGKNHRQRWRFRGKAERLSAYSMHFVTCADAKGLYRACQEGLFPGISITPRGGGAPVLSIPRSKLLGIASWFLTGQTPAAGKGRPPGDQRRDTETATWASSTADRIKVAALLARPVAPPLRALMTLVLLAAARHDLGGGVEADELGPPARKRQRRSARRQVTGRGAYMHLRDVAARLRHLVGEITQQEQGEGGTARDHDAGPGWEARMAALHACRPSEDAILRQDSLPGPYPSAREQGSTWRRCRECRWKLCEELEVPCVPRDVLEQLRGEAETPPAAGGADATGGHGVARPRPAYALCWVARELLRAQAALPSLMTVGTAVAIVELGTGDREGLLSVCLAHVPRLLAMLEPYGAAMAHMSPDGKPVASPLLAELAVRLAQTRLLVDQQLALELARREETEVKTMPSSYLPAATGSLSHIDALDSSGTPICDPDTTLPVRRQYVRIVRHGDGPRGVATPPRPESEVRTVPDQLHAVLQDANVAPSLHLERDDSGGGRGATETCSHADRKRKPRANATCGMCTFFCEHACVMGAAAASPCPAPSTVPRAPRPPPLSCAGSPRLHCPPLLLAKGAM